MPEGSKRQDDRGRGAKQPSSIPARGWKDVFWRTVEAFSKHRLLSLAAGVTYYGLLAIFPAIAAAVAIYGLFANPSSIQSQIQELSTILPGGAIDVIGGQLKSLSTQHSKTMGIAFFGGLLISLWSASSGIKGLFDALNVVYDEEERRSFLRLSAIALVFTIGAMVFLVIAAAAIVGVPVVVNDIGLNGTVGWVLDLVRWPLLLIAVAFGLALVYRFGPSREAPRWRWVTWGSGFASVAWLIGSGLFSWYAAHFGSYNATYGSLGAVIGFMTWLWLSATVVLLGGQINAELEHQTARDTTTGPEQPRGQRGARMADTVGPARD